MARNKEKLSEPEIKAEIDRRTAQAAQDRGRVRRATQFMDPARVEDTLSGNRGSPAPCGTARWVDLLDPSEQEVMQCWPGLHKSDLNQLLKPSSSGAEESRTRLENRGDWLFGVFLSPVCVEEEDRVFFREINLVATSDLILTVRKTPSEGDAVFDPARLEGLCAEGETDAPGMLVYQLLDAIADDYLDLVEALDREINELEDNLETWDSNKIRTRLSCLRHDLLQARQKLGPMRDVFRRIYDDQLDLPDHDFFPRDIEVRFAEAYDKVLRVTDSLELLRDLASGVRDYHQAQVANEQNEVMKRLTIVASVLLVPTLIVGIYGQNFIEMPETSWAMGYLWSWALIGLTTLGQILYFRKKGWIGRKKD